METVITAIVEEPKIILSKDDIAKRNTSPKLGEEIKLFN